MRRGTMKETAPASPTFRCAIYTRKSTEEGLEQEFNSLDAQREACEAFVASQRGEGWELVPDRYDDGGYSGGNTERPALKRLMADVEALGRLISLALRSGIPIKEIYRQVRGISSDRTIGLGPNKVLSVPDAVGIAIERYMHEKQGIQQELLPGAAASAAPAPIVAQPASGPAGEQMVLSGLQETLSGACPDCGSQLEFAEGCMKCYVCGFSECG